MNVVFDQIKKQFKQSDNAVNQLIIINVAVFIILGLTSVIFDLAGFQKEKFIELYSTQWLSLNDNLNTFITHPWTLITYAFMHSGLPHLFGNMFGLYFLGRFFSQEFGSKKLIGIYLVGAIGAGLFYLLIENTLPYYASASGLVGASGSVIAILIALGTLYPNREVRLFFFLPVKLIWVALGFFVISLLSVTGSNGGGEIAHIGGAISGFLFAKLYQRNIDITKPFTFVLAFFSGLFKPKPKMNVSYKSSKKYSNKVVEDVDFSEISQSEIDTILDKLRVSGYTSLTDKEKRTLFEYSKQ